MNTSDFDTLSLAALKGIADQRGIAYPSTITKIALLHILWTQEGVGTSHDQWEGFIDDRAQTLFQSFNDMMSETIEVKEMIGSVIPAGCTCQLFGPSGHQKRSGASKNATA